MAEYLAPGVYVEEFESGVKAMEGVGTGYRYTCQVGGKICHLTYEENYRWFMERK